MPEAIGEEIARLLKPGFIREVLHTKWLANPVMVAKNSTWHMCIDYRLINKACPKNLAPPRIGQVIDSMDGCERLSFLDAYSVYHQIKMNESDE